MSNHLVNNKEGLLIPEYILTLIHEKRYFGRMNDPVSSSCIKGICGDEMEFYLVIEDNMINDIKFYTDGCMCAVACGTVTAHLAIGKTIAQALGISPEQVIEELKSLPQHNCHCAILAVSTLYRAIADYWLKI